MTQSPKYTMTMNLNILNHLGLNLYSNVAAVISEAVANAWDADATVVEINLLPAEGKIEIVDNGNGMTTDEINSKYLQVGRKKRESGDALSDVFSRPVMGRKGIGKLSLFSIAKSIKIESVKAGEKSALEMTTAGIESQVTINNGIYHPTDLGSSAVTISQGTKITLNELKRNIENTENQLRRKLARRFSIIGVRKNFSVRVDNEEVTIKDRNFYNYLEFVWPIDLPVADFDGSVCPNAVKIFPVNGTVDNDKGWKITGWIGSVQNTKQLREDRDKGATDNKIIILSRGKLVQENILDTFNIGSIYAKYLIGEINADFLDSDDLDDISTSNRQALIEDDDRYKALLFHLSKLLRQVQKEWESGRSGMATKKALEEFPVLDEWYSSLKSSVRKHAEQLFSTIQNLHFDKEDDSEIKRKELYKQGILAFERLRVRENLAALDTIQSAADIKFAGIFSDVDEIEALLYHDIAAQRVAVIKELSRIVDDNEKERVIQTHIFDNLWLLNPSWERATQGSARMEQRVKQEFDNVDHLLTLEEQKGRFDIKYRTSAGKHIIIELKRYNPGYEITTGKLIDQVEKYTVALRKCLKEFKREHEPIEVICILGNPMFPDRDQVRKSLASVNARLVHYNELIQDSLEGYQEFLDTNTEVNRIRQIIERI